MQIYEQTDWAFMEFLRLGGVGGWREKLAACETLTLAKFIPKGKTALLVKEGLTFNFGCRFGEDI